MSKDMTNSTDLIRTVETLARDAWPAAERVEHDGWVLRATAGVTRRANSVWPNRTAPTRPLAARLDEVEAFYTARGLPARFQICPAARPANLDDVLAAHGYGKVAETAVQTTSIDALLVRTVAPATLESAAVQVTLESVASSAWYAAYCASEEVSRAAQPVRRAILRRIAAPAAFVSLTVDGQLVALGQGVVDGGWLGIFSMATLPAHRRRGHATRVIQALAVWAQSRGATQSYLQVMLHNQAGRALYARLGYSTLYHYHYRELPLRED